jgi:diguanylate cyclase (GGDEF)-like protein
MHEVTSSQDGAFVVAVSQVQALATGGGPPQETYQAALDGALRLLEADSGSLRLVDLEDPSWMVAVATQGSAGAGERWRHRAPITEGVSGRAISTGQLVVIEDDPRANTNSQLAPPGTEAIIGVPVHERGHVTGSLVVGSKLAGRHWTQRERDLLSAYAEHVGVAVAVARASHAVEQAFTDSLTGLGNRGLLLDRLEHGLVRADRGGEPATVLFLDLDRFKLVNDSLGHFVGDRLLIAVAERLRHCVRDGDLCARLGGDEFAVLLADGSNPVGVAERIIDALQRRFQIDEHEVFISASVGIATGREEAETLLRNADMAMYHAKRVGGGRYQRFEPSMHAALVSRLGLDAELRRAVERGEFVLHYQPVVELSSGRIRGFEALVRWRHPVRGLVAPLEFIPVAEENGLIGEIGRWVLEQACSQLALWWDESPLTVGVNVSIRELQEPDYAEAVRRAIGDRFPPSALIIELTESARLEDSTSALTGLHALKRLGARVALDDFGTGYSSLLNLAHVPVDALKIPRPFLEAALSGGRTSSALLPAMLEMARRLGLTTVVEGIERPRHHALVVELGCEFGQGYLLGRPVDAAGADELLRAERAATASRSA